MRKKLTDANLNLFSILIDSYLASILHEYDDSVKDQLFEEARKVQHPLASFHKLKALGQILDTPERRTLPNDETAHVTSAEKGWKSIVFDQFVANFGRYGDDAISSIAELTLYTNALAHAFGSSRIFYRGEEKYGYKLQSRAERYMNIESDLEPGLTEREMKEIRRFQNQFRTNISQYNFREDIPNDDSPLWLPIMQHYDEGFGTRLLDISTSPFTGLYFACIGWSGDIDPSYDGIVYLFQSRGIFARGTYHDTRPEEFDEDYDDLPAASLSSLFKNWKFPEGLRVYQSSMHSPREIAQDGLFLVRGKILQEKEYGQGFKFRIPGDAKLSLAKELWLAGYTPRRMVRGPKGEEAHKKLRKILSLNDYWT